MLIERVELKNFTVFADATFELTNGVNVFIGRNSTGKTHAMKALYAFLRAAASTDEPFSTSVGHQLREVFKPDDDALGRLGQRRPGQRTFRIRVSSGNKELFAQVYSRDGRITSRVSLGDVPAAVFIPSREALAMHDGFTRAYERRELSFDGTYYNLARELTTAPLRGNRPGALGEVVGELQRILGNVTLTEGKLRFSFSGVKVVRRWDGSSAYMQGIRRLSTTSAADFCAILEQNDAPVILEVTDYRGYRLGEGGSKQVLSSGALVAETVAKVRDSVAGMLWACARSMDAAGDPAVESIVRYIVNRHDGPPKLQVVFWLEDDVLQPHEASTIAAQVEAGLRHWRRPKVIVTNKRIEKLSKVRLAWLSVT